MNDSRRNFLICFLLAVLTVGVFLPVLRGDFVNYDDTAYVTENPPVLAGLTPAGIAWAFDGAHFGNWHPLTWIAHMADVQLFGLQPGGHHLVSLLLHIANTVLLFLLLARVTRQVPAAAFVAALFAVHPLHVESVAWISERKDVLSTFFALLSLLAYVGCVDAPASRKALGKGIGLYAAALACFALGLMSKAMVVTLPAVMLLLDYWPLQRFAGTPPATPAKGALRLVWEKVPFFALAFGATWLAVTCLKQSGATQDAPNVSLGERLVRVTASYQHYLGKLFWPSDLIIPFLRPAHWPLGTIVSSIVVVAGLTFLAIWLWRRCPYLFVGWFWFVGTLLPVVGVIPVGAHLYADRYTYFPLIGLLLAGTWSALALAARWKIPGGVLMVAAVLVVTVCGDAATAQVRYWHNSETLYRHTLSVMPDNYLARNGLGLFYASQHRAADAIAEYQRAIAINPQYDDAYSNLGRALAGMGDYAAATPQFEAALRIRPDDVKSLNNYGNVLVLRKRYADAASQYQRLLRLQPDYANAHNNLAVCWKNLGKTGEAIAEYRETLRLAPNSLEAINNLAWIFATDADARYRDGEQAVSLATRGCELTHYQNATLVATLAAAYGETRRYQEAMSFAQQALALAGNQPALAQRAAVMLKNFQNAQPYREN
jgi:tetratricopeptide (TPR) repeat protein